MQLLRLFVNLCLLRAGPHDLPGSQPLLSLTFTLNVIVGALMMATNEPHFGAALLVALADSSLMLLCIRVGLSATRHPARFNQSANALLGSGALLGLLALPLLSLSAPAGAPPPAEPHPASLLLLPLILWSLMVVGHILRHTFEVRLSSGVLIGLAYNVASYLLLNQLFTAL